MSEPEKQAKPTVFGYVDQEQVIARIDTVSDDDLSSCFFGDSLQDIEDAATRMFDVGVRGDPDNGPAPAARGSFAQPAPSSTPTEPASLPLPERLDRDAEARAAFILHGPSGMASA
jgi:hypothetical protein